MGNIEPQHSTTCTIVILLVCLCTHTIKGVGEFRCHAQPVPTPYFGLARISCVYNQTSSHKQKRQSSTLSIHLSYLSSEGREFARIEVGLAVFHWEWPRLFLNAWSIKGLVRSGNKYFVAQKCSMAPAYILIRPHLLRLRDFSIYIPRTDLGKSDARIDSRGCHLSNSCQIIINLGLVGIRLNLFENVKKMLIRIRGGFLISPYVLHFRDTYHDPRWRRNGNDNENSLVLPNHLIS